MTKLVKNKSLKEEEAMENILKKSYKMFINGEWVNSSNGIMVKTYAPYNNELFFTFFMTVPSIY